MATLNRVTDKGEWSPARVYRHLVLSNDPYIAKMNESLATLPSTSGSKEFKPTWFGGFLAKQAGPGTNVPAPKPLVPEAKEYDASVVSDWAASHEALIGVMERARGKDVVTKCLRNPFLPVFRMSLGDCILIFTNHTERHILQIEERILEV